MWVREADADACVVGLHLEEIEGLDVLVSAEKKNAAARQAVATAAAALACCLLLCCGPFAHGSPGDCPRVLRELRKGWTECAR